MSVIVDAPRHDLAGAIRLQDGNRRHEQHVVSISQGQDAHGWFKRTIYQNGVMIDRYEKKKSQPKTT